MQVGGMSDIEALLAANDGIILARDHRRLRSSLSRWVKQGKLARIMCGVYVHPDMRIQDRLRAVAARMPGAVIADESALTWLFNQSKCPTTIKVFTPTRRRPQAGYHFVRRVIPQEHVQDGIMRPVLAAVDVCDKNPFWLDELARQNRATTADYEQALAEFPFRRGNPQRARNVKRTSTKPWSVFERTTHDVFDRFGVTGWIANRAIVVGGSVIIPDIAFDAERLIVELNGYEFHSGRLAFERDQRRTAALMREGWAVLTLTWDMVVHHPEWVIRTLADIRAERRAYLRGRRHKPIVVP